MSLFFRRALRVKLHHHHHHQFEAIPNFLPPPALSIEAIPNFLPPPAPSIEAIPNFLPPLPLPPL
jgi:hypothetical protein